MFLVDTNVLLDIFTNDAKWRSWSEHAVRDALVTGSVGINPIIYAEASPAFVDAGRFDRSLDALMVARLQLPYAAAFTAGRAFLQYRRAGGTRTSPLPDFYIGAHAITDGLVLLTRDVARYRTYFPSIALITPDSQS